MSGMDGHRQMKRVVSDEDQEALARALEEAAERVRQAKPAGYDYEVDDNLERIPTDHHGGYIMGPRSPRVRYFRVEW